MFSRLPITLAQLKAGNNSEKSKNEIRQLLHSLYRSKKLTKTIYDNLVNTILKWRQYLRALKIAKQMKLTDLD